MSSKSGSGKGKKTDKSQAAEETPNLLPDQYEEKREQSILKAAESFIVPQVPPAEKIFNDLVAQIQRFETTLSKDHEVGAILANFSQQVTLRIEEIGIVGGAMLLFRGVMDGEECRTELIQHFSQINILLTALPVHEERDEPRRIGFIQEPKKSE